MILKTFKSWREKRKKELQIQKRQVIRTAIINTLTKFPVTYSNKFVYLPISMKNNNYK